MSWFFTPKGNASGNYGEVDVDHQLLVTTNQDPTKAGAFRLYDAEGTSIVAEENGSLSVSQDEVVFSDQVDGSALNTNKWTTSTSTLTVAVSSGFIILNSGAATTSGSYAILNSIIVSPLYSDMPIEYAFTAKVSIQPQSNATIELGLGVASGTSIPTDGAFFRWNANGSFQAVVNNNGSETVANCVLPAGSTSTLPPTNDTTRLYLIVVAEDHVQFIFRDEVVADIAVPVAFSFPVNLGHQALYARVYTGSSAPAQAPVLSIGQAMIRQIGVDLNRPWHDVIASLGQGSYQSPVTTFAQTANHTNSTAPSNATLSNTAAGYTTLGGRWAFAAVAGAATDFALFGYQVPSPFKFYCTGVDISSIDTGAAVTITATIFDWSLGVNASAVSLATADNPSTSWAPRRIPMGMQGFRASDGIGYTPADIIRTFDPPLVVDANRFFHVILNIPVGSATALEVFRGTVTVHGYFE